MTQLPAWAGGYTDAGGILTSPASLQGADDSTYARWISAGRNATANWYATTFDLSEIPAGSTVNSVTVRIKGYTSHTGSPLDYLHAQLYAGITPKGATFENLALTTLSSNVWATFQYTDVAYADLASLQVWFEGDRANSTVSSTIYVDSVQLTVDYTAGGGDQQFTETDSNASVTETVTVAATPEIQADAASGTDAESLSQGGGDQQFTETDSAIGAESYQLDTPPTAKPGKLWIRRKKN